MKYVGEIYTPDAYIAFADNRLVDALNQCGISCVAITSEDLVDEAFTTPLTYGPDASNEFPRRPTPDPTHALAKRDFKAALERLDTMEPPLEYIDYDGRPVTAGDLLFRAMVVGQRALLQRQTREWDALHTSWQQQPGFVGPYAADAA